MRSNAAATLKSCTHAAPPASSPVPTALCRRASYHSIHLQICAPPERGGYTHTSCSHGALSPCIACLSCTPAAPYFSHGALSPCCRFVSRASICAPTERGGYKAALPPANPQPPSPPFRLDTSARPRHAEAVNRTLSAISHRTAGQDPECRTLRADSRRSDVQRVRRCGGREDVNA